MKDCPKCSLPNDDSASICSSCGAPFDTPLLGADPSAGKNPVLKTWLIIDALLLVALVCLGVFLPYPAQAYLVLFSAVGVIAALVLLIAAFPARWKKAPAVLTLMCFLLTLTAVGVIFPNKELVANGSIVLTMLRGETVRTTAAGEAAAVEAAASPSHTDTTASSAAPSPTEVSPTPETSPAFWAAPSPSVSPSPSPSASPSIAPSPSPSPSATPSPSPSPESALVVSPSAEPSAGFVIVTAADFLAKYAANELSADRSFKGKTLQLTGVFESLSVTNGVIQVFLDDGKDTRLGTVCCSFDSSAANTLIDLQQGDSVVLQGLCRGKTPALTLDRCVLVR